MKSTVIALAGKGGVGKTSISAAIVRELVRIYPDKRILAIDADPAIGLATALGIKNVGQTIDDIRKSITQAGEEDKTKKKAIELLGEARFQLLNAMVETQGFAFLAVGRPEAAGCYCSVNSYLKQVISAVSDEFDFVVIDGEAGIEQINRRVMEKVTHLILVTDPSRKGTNVIKVIKQVADELTMYSKIGVIVNRYNDTRLDEFLNLGDLKVIAKISDDKELALTDVMGKSVLDLDDDSPLVKGVKEALDNLDIKGGKDI